MGAGMSGGKVTDPALLAQLDSGKVNDPALLAQLDGGKVTDPALLAQLGGPSLGDAIARGATRGIGDRILARAQALGAQQGGADPNNPLQSFDAIQRRPVDEARFEQDRARDLQARRAAGAAAAQAHPVAYAAGQLAPAMATMALPAAGTVAGAGALSGALGVAQSESDDPRQLAMEGGASALAGAGATGLLKAVGAGASAVGRTLLPKSVAIRDAIANRIADRSAASAEALARSARGTLGAVSREGQSAIRDLSVGAGLPAAEQAANQAVLASPELQDLAVSAAQKTRAKVPGILEQIESARALAEQTAADAAAARSPSAVAAMEAAMRSETAKRLLTRYALPAAGGYVAGEAAGGHGGLGAIVGFNARPMVRATLRGLASPGFTAPMSRATTALADMLAGVDGDTAARIAAALATQAKSPAEFLTEAIRSKAKKDGDSVASQ